MPHELSDRVADLHLITAEPHPHPRHHTTRLASSIPQTPRRLSAWLAANLDLHITDHPLIHGHHSPLDYLAHVFFEGRFVRDADGHFTPLPADAPRTADCVVWANRGGGKTYLGAVATLLDLLFKPHAQVRILAGSLEQARRMHTYVVTLAELPAIARQLDSTITTRTVRVEPGGAAEILAASQTSVRGTRVQKLRCDEVDLFTHELWAAAQLVTRSMSPCVGPWGGHIRGSVEALSTMHLTHGIMSQIVSGAMSAGGADCATEGSNSGAAPATPPRPVFRWGVVDSLERCEPSRSCTACPLHEECGGRAKDPSRAPGHITIDDAIALKSRVDVATWKSEMLCLRPSTRHAVYPEFDPALHVIAADDPRLSSRRIIAWYGAMDFGIRAESVVLLASEDDSGLIIVEHEHAAADQPVTAQIERLRRWLEAGLTRVSEVSPLVRPAAGGLVHVAIDPAGNNRSDQTGEPNAALLRRAGWRVLTPRRGIEDGLRLVRRRLAPANVSHGPRLLVHARCRRLIECLLRYRYPERDLASCTPEKGDFDHACDALRYLIVSLDAPASVRVEGY